MQRCRDWAAHTWLAPLTTCPFCLSVWVAGGLWAAWTYGATPGRALVNILAISELAIILEYTIRKLNSFMGRPLS